MTASRQLERSFHGAARLTIRLVLACGLIHFGATAIRADDHKPPVPPREVTYCQLAQDPSSYVGKRVRVRGLYRYAFELSRFDAPECCPSGKIGIAVGFGPNMDRHAERLFRKLDKKGAGIAIVVFVGTFEGGGPFGTFADRFQITVDSIEKLKKRAVATKVRCIRNGYPRIASKHRRVSDPLVLPTELEKDLLVRNSPETS